MKLSIADRIILLQILPKQGSFVTFKILMDLKASIAFNEAEIKECNIKESEGRVTWDKLKDKEVTIGERATEIIQEALRKIDKEEKINEQTYTLFEKFIKL